MSQFRSRRDMRAREEYTLCFRFRAWVWFCWGCTVRKVSQSVSWSVRYGTYGMLITCWKLASNRSRRIFLRRSRFGIGLSHCLADTWRKMLTVGEGFHGCSCWACFLMGVRIYGGCCVEYGCNKMLSVCSWRK